MSAGVTPYGVQATPPATGDEITAYRCVVESAEALRHAHAVAEVNPPAADALVRVSEGWTQLGHAMATTQGLQKPKPQPQGQ